jgi:hypothetical protein
MKTASIVVAAVAYALVASTARAATEDYSAANGEPISCLSYLSQFEGAVIYNPGAPRLEEAQALADKGRNLCKVGNEKVASAYLIVALRELGVTPMGTTAPPPVIIMQDARRPLAQPTPDDY